MVRGWTLNETQTKTIYLDKLNNTSNAVCIKDAEVYSMSEMSSSCNGENETMVLCNGELQSGYRCAQEERLILSGARHSAVREFYSSSAPVPDSGSSTSSGTGSGGGGGGGSSCPAGKTLQNGKCVVPARAISEQIIPLPPVEAPESTEKQDVKIVEKDIEISFSNAKPAVKPLLATIPFGSEITGAITGVPEKSLKVIPLLVLATLFIFGGGIMWWMRWKR